MSFNMQPFKAKIRQVKLVFSGQFNFYINAFENDNRK